MLAWERENRFEAILLFFHSFILSFLHLFIPFRFLELKGKKKWLLKYPSQNWPLPKMWVFSTFRNWLVQIYDRVLHIISRIFSQLDWILFTSWILLSIIGTQFLNGFQTLLLLTFQIQFRFQCTFVRFKVFPINFLHSFTFSKFFFV